MRLINSGPEVSSSVVLIDPGKFAISCVETICPPNFVFSKSKTLSRALALYKAAVNPAGPPPIIITSYISLSSSHKYENNFLSFDILLF